MANIKEFLEKGWKKLVIAVFMLLALGGGLFSGIPVLTPHTPSVGLIEDGIIDQSSSQYMTNAAFQTRMVTAANRLYNFYCNGSYLLYASSADGENWTLPSTDNTTRIRSAAAGTVAYGGWIDGNYSMKDDSSYAYTTQAAAGNSTAAPLRFDGLDMATYVTSVRLRLDVWKTVGASIDTLYVDWEGTATRQYTLTTTETTVWFDYTNETLWSPFTFGQWDGNYGDWDVKVYHDRLTSPATTFKMDYAALEIKYYEIGYIRNMTDDSSYVSVATKNDIYGDYISYAVGSSTGNVPLYFGHLRADYKGRLWREESEGIAVTAISGISFRFPTITYDSSGYAWIGYRNYTSSVNANPCVTKNSRTDGLWTTASSFPYKLSNTNEGTYAVKPVPLTGGKVYVVWTCSGSTNKHVNGTLWNGSTWGTAEKINNQASDSLGSYAYFTAGNSTDDVYVAWQNGTAYCINFRLRNATASAWNDTKTVADLASAVSPVMTIVNETGDAYIYWLNDPTAKHLYNRTYIRSSDSFADQIDVYTDTETITGAPRIQALPICNRTTADWTHGSVVAYTITVGSVYKIRCVANDFVASEALYIKMKMLLDKINWGNEEYKTSRNAFTILNGMIFGKNTTAQLENLIDSIDYSTNIGWQEILYLSSVCEKMGIQRTNAIKNALTYATMTPSDNIFPATWITDSPYHKEFKVSDKWGLMGYYWANKLNHETTKWNLTKAFDEFNYTVHLVNGDLQSLYNRTHYTSWHRYYDEKSSIVQDYLLFYKMGITGALAEATEEWNVCVQENWNPAYDMYDYLQTSEGVFECEAGYFLEDAALYKYYNFSMDHWDRVIQDFGNRFLATRWGSYQWGGSRWWFYAILHSYTTNTQSRLQNTLAAWSSLIGASDLFNSTYVGYLRDLLTGYEGYDPAWRSMFYTPWGENYQAHGAGYYDITSGKFSWSDEYSATDSASAYALNLLMLLGTIPYSGSVAVQLEDYNYEHNDMMNDPDVMGMNFTNYSVKLPMYLGEVGFQYGTKQVNYTFSSSGVYNITFSSDWNTINSATKLSDLPTTRIWLKNVVSTHLNVGWNNLTINDEDWSKTLGQINASLNYDGISWKYVVYEFTNSTSTYQYAFIYQYKVYATVTLTPHDNDWLLIYCNVEDYWYHFYG